MKNTKPTFIVLNANCLDALKTMEDTSIDSICTDPPYGLNFMNKGWDKVLPDPAIWKECLRVLKPGGHMIAFGAPKLYHRLACSIEDQGFEIRDSLMWLFGSGFPKSLDVSKAIDSAAGAVREVVGPPPYTRGTPTQAYNGQRKVSWDCQPGPITAPATPEAAQWAGYGTALKPAYEPILLARKPLEGTVAATVLKWGTGGLNIDGCRVGGDAGRWPANLILDETAGSLLDEQSGITQSSNAVRKNRAFKSVAKGAESARESFGFKDSGGASRFFYCAKASKKEREAGLESMPSKTERKNTHPTVKPISLMQWLVRLITPPGGTVLDPFTGSGSTGCAAMKEGFDFIGCELSEEYVEIANKRIEHARINNDVRPQGAVYGGRTMALN